MNEKIDLTKILKDCPKGTKLYSTIYGVVEFHEIQESRTYPILLYTNNACIINVASDGRLDKVYNGECTLFPSKDQRDWSKFTTPRYKRDRFDPKTLKPFDKVIVRDGSRYTWVCNFFSHIINECDLSLPYKYMSTNSCYVCCIPYNEETKHLVGTTDEAPEYYRYWED